MSQGTADFAEADASQQIFKIHVAFGGERLLEFLAGCRQVALQEVLVAEEEMRPAARLIPGRVAEELLFADLAEKIVGPTEVVVPLSPGFEQCASICIASLVRQRQDVD